MRGMADLAMRDPKHAIILASLFAALPMLFWVSAAIVSLVILRRGVAQGAKVFAWALLPAIAWAAQGQFSTIIGLTGTALLAVVLRQTVSWHKTLLALLPLGAITALLFGQLAQDAITQISAMVTVFIQDYLQQAGDSSDMMTAIKPMIEPAVIGVMTWVDLVMVLLGLVLARSWQARLYNPGGFREEFHGIRLPAGIACGLMAIALLSVTIDPMMLVLAPAATLPLCVAGLSLVHGLTGMGSMSRFWLIGVYVLLIVTMQLAYPVIILTACLDSVFDFRARAARRLNR